MHTTNLLLLSHFGIKKQLVVNLLGMTDESIFHENLRQRLYDQIGVNASGLESLGLLEDKPIDKYSTPLDTLSNYLSKRLAFSNPTTHP